MTKLKVGLYQTTNMENICLIPYLGELFPDVNGGCNVISLLTRFPTSKIRPCSILKYNRCDVMVMLIRKKIYCIPRNIFKDLSVQVN